MTKIDFKKLGTASEYRSAPFWSWNGKLKPEEVRRQINVMQKMGMGGFYMHSRMGLSTEYMSEDWFDSIKAGVDEARKLGMEANFYDEDRWPSGAGGGFVTADRKYRMRYLELYNADEAIPGRAEDVLHCWYYAVRTDEENLLLEYRRAEAEEKLSAPWRLVKIAVRIAHDQLGFNNAAYLDTMNPEAVQAFIDFTHEKYYAECGDDFGKAAPYFFTDEPNYLDLIDHRRRPWSERMPELFKAEMQAEVTEFLPEFFFRSNQDFSGARYWYYRIISGLFCDTFMRMIGEWCEKHNIKFTGHVLLEDTLSRQAFAVGAAMPCYEYMQMPGIDLLTETWIVLNTARQAASAARQLGRKRVLSETYGCTGWDFPLAGHKALGDWQYAMGINYRCQHLYWYSMLGQSKRDYPASIGGQSPWHEVYAPLEDYFGRLSELLSNADLCADLLVLHPIESLWGRVGDFDKDLSYVPEMDRKFNTLAAQLAGNHVDFDYGDETLLSRYGAVKDNALVMGKVLYKAIYLPEVLTLRSTTVKLLQEFAAAGGRICYSGAVPRYIDGKVDKDNVLSGLYSHFTRLDETAFAETLAAEFGHCSIKNGQQEADEIISCVKKIDGDTRLIFAANMGCKIGDDIFDQPWVLDRQAGFESLQWTLNNGSGCTVRELDIYSGELYEVDFRNENGTLVWNSAMEPLQSRCYIIGPTEALICIAPPADGTAAAKIELQPQATVFSEKNLLVLDHADIRIEGELAAKNEYVLEADKLFREKLGVNPRGGAALQPWKMAEQPTHDIAFELDFAFECGSYLPTDLHLVMESPELFAIEVNGAAQSNKSCGFWCDPALELVALPPEVLQCGVNHIKLRGKYNGNFAGLEAIYLYGDFGVDQQDRIIAAGNIVAGCSLTDQAMPYYSGNTTYNYKFRMEKAGRCKLDIGKWHGSALGVRWDNGEEKLFYSQPYTMNSAVLEAGEHSLQITVYGHRRNAFGPFYWHKSYSWIGWYEFQIVETQKKLLVDLGLTGSVKLTALSD